MSANPDTSAAANWQTRDNKHYLHPFTDHHGLGKSGTRIIQRADGVYIYDIDGNKILDGMAGLWCVNMGYGREDLVEAAARQMRELPYYNSFFQTSHPPAIALAERIAGVAPEGFDLVFFAGSGSEANDTNIKLVRRYWDLVGQPDKRFFISRRNAYHGSTVAAASLGGMGPMHDQLGPMVNFIHHIEQPYHFGLGRDQSPEAFGHQQASLLEAKILELGAENVAAFIAEPVQGAGGVIIPPPGYWEEIQRICTAHDVLLIADEVITGFGRLGEWFGSQHLGIKPDLITFAKGVTSGYLPLGGSIVGSRIGAVMREEGGEFAHGYTYSGHPTVCAVALANINALDSEGVIDTVRTDTAPYLAERLSSLADHPIVGEARSIGLMGAIEIVADKDSGERFHKDLGAGGVCRDHCFANGLVMRAVGDSMIISPPLVITRAQIDELIEKARRCLDLTARDLAAA